MTTKPTYSIREFVATFGVSRSAVYRELRDGRLKAAKAGRRTIITGAHAEDWLRRLPAFEPQKAD